VCWLQRAVLTALLCATPVRAADPTPATFTSGHQRMLALLADIARRSPEDNIYTGEQQARAFRALVADPQFTATPKRRWRNLRTLGYHELRLGNNEAAIESFAAARAITARVEPPLRTENIDRTDFELALAYLRWGESQNCVARHTSDSCILPIRDGGVHTNQNGSRKGIAVLEEMLQRSPDHLPARWLLNIAYMTVGEYPDGVPARYRIPPGTFDSAQPFARFVDVAAQRGVNTMDLGGGAAVAGRQHLYR